MKGFVYLFAILCNKVKRCYDLKYYAQGCVKIVLLLFTLPVMIQVSGQTALLDQNKLVLSKAINNK